MNPLIIHPGSAIGPYELGKSRQELWSRSRSPVLSYYAQSTDAERCDEFTLDQVTVHYDSKTQLSYFLSLGIGQPQVLLFNEPIAGFSSPDLQMLLELAEVPFKIEEERLLVPSLGLTFGFKETGKETKRLDYINLEAAS